MKLEFFIAKRYLASKHKINFITIISFISTAGITIGVAALLVVLSVFNGFSTLVTSFLVSLDPHIRIEVTNVDGYRQLDEIVNLLDELPHVKYHSPFVTSKVLALKGNQTSIVNIKGVDKESSEKVTGLNDNIVKGDYFSENKTSLPEIVIGLPLAYNLGTFEGDTITIVSPAGIERVITQFSLPVTQQFKVAGLFFSNNNEYDSYFMFTPLQEAQRLLGMQNRIQGYELILDNIKYSEKVKEILYQKIDTENFSVNTWYDFHKDLYSVMQIERWTAYIILSLIIAVATFNILASLTMTVIEKKRDIGILRAMGTDEKSVLKIFMFEGMLIGFIGTALGFVLGLFVIWLQIEYNIYPLDPTQYKINSLPVETRFSDFFAVGGAALLLSFIASLYPAKRAAKTDLLESIKWE